MLRGEDGSEVDRREFSVDLNTGAAVDWYLRHFTKHLSSMKFLLLFDLLKLETKPAVLTDVGKCVSSIGVGSAGPSRLVPAGWYVAPAAASSSLLTGLELNTLHSWDPARCSARYSTE